MKKIVFCLMFALTAVFIAQPTFAAKKDPKVAAIKARQGEMQLRKFNAGPLFAMAKGKMPYNAEMAGKLAGNLKLLLDLDNGRAWMKGTSNKEYPKKTTSLPKIWEKGSEIGDYAKDYSKAVNGVAASAGNGQEALKVAIKDLGKACKSCHDDFREDKKKKKK